MILLLVLVQILTPKKDRLQPSIELMTLEKTDQFDLMVLMVML
ncbi:hypothetical protein RKT74_00270 [Leclercia pneumoniae]|nr:hypothetical protein [Leclercia pneumoniae]MCV2513959.1 hypothetical protein [Leclercia pneumoniae]WNN81296.1 hypothetical protein RKT74_00270 [Leclercia pneumoniae]